MLTIGETKLATRRPSDIDAALVAASGCNAAEHAAIIARGTPFEIARAALPFLTGDDAPSIGELAELIANADIVDMRQQVAALLAPALVDQSPAAGDAA